MIFLIQQPYKHDYNLLNVSPKSTEIKLQHLPTQSLGSRLSEIMIDESPDVCSIIVGDERQEAREEEEDYLDEGLIGKFMMKEFIVRRFICEQFMMRELRSKKVIERV